MTTFSDLPPILSVSNRGFLNEYVLLDSFI
jgi:hypothetical protein